MPPSNHQGLTHHNSIHLILPFLDYIFLNLARRFHVLFFLQEPVLWIFPFQSLVASASTRPYPATHSITMPDNASQAGGSAAGMLAKKIRAWKPSCCKKSLTIDAASDAGTPASVVEVSPPVARQPERQVIQFGATQHYNNYPGNIGQQMSWTYDPQRVPPPAPQVNGSGLPGPVNWGQQEEAVTSFAVGSYQGYHGFSVSLKPETYLSMAPEQQAAFINLGRGRNFNPPATPAPAPQVPAPAPLRSVLEETPPEPPVPAIEEPKSKCVECEKQLMINIQSYQCNTGPMCGTCYHLALRRCSMFEGSGHTC